MKIYFSESKCGFYFESMMDLYKDAGNWPSDVVEISLDVYKIYQGQPPDGSVLGGGNGLPIWVNYQQD